MVVVGKGGVNSVLVGRARELAELDAAPERVPEGRPSAVLLPGQSARDWPGCCPSWASPSPTRPAWPPRTPEADSTHETRRNAGTLHSPLGVRSPGRGAKVV